jgi:hypothetical protein
VNVPAYLRENYEVSNVQIGLTAAEEAYYANMTYLEYGFPCVDGVEIAMVGAGIGGGFVNTNELHTIKYEEAMSTKERPSWIQAIEEEFDNMTDHGVFEPVEKSKIPAGAKVLSTTWVMKKKASGRFKARITARGFEQRDGDHFDSSDKASPVVYDITIRMILTLFVMAGFWTEIVDVRGAFLTAEFDPNHKMYVSVPKGLEKHFPGNVVLLLKKSLYGTCQAAGRSSALL